ncbi:hypothetical protein ACN2WE_29680 [Streptomyces sp. cg28]|uniref:hypothetical protein n=1 Tax=Streptomyces sp. cg28 TaxID=3403457 RepID=UPI003B21DAC2
MYESVTAETAAERIVAWHGEGEAHLVELMGSAGSGRASILARVREAVPDAVSIDATGLAPRALADRVRDALRGRPDTGAPGLVLVASGQRIASTAPPGSTGPMRTPGYPDAALNLLNWEIVRELGALVVVEVDWHDTWFAGRRRLEVRPPDRSPSSPEASPEWALQALALAPRGLVPLEVWRHLSQSLNGGDLDLPLDASDISAVGDSYRIDDWDRAQELAVAVDPGTARRVHDEVAHWLRGHAGEASDLGGYAERALAVHAAKGGRYGDYFQELKQDPALLSLLSPHSLIESERLVAAHLPCVRRDPAYRDRYARWSAASLPAWAEALEWAGLETYERDEWMSWLVLAARAQGDEETASAVAAAVPERTWTVRWARWRPPGVIDPRSVFPGPVTGLDLAPDGWDPKGRPAVVARDDTPSAPRFWVFDAATGEVLAGPWTDGVPAFGQSEPAWQNGGGRLRAWAAFDPFPPGPRLVQDQLRVGDLVVVASAGGIFAVEATEPGRFADGFPGPRTADAEDDWDDDEDEDDDLEDLEDLDLDEDDDDFLGRAMPSPRKAQSMEVVSCHVAPGQAGFAASPEAVFGAASLVRLPASLLPADLSDPATRHTLTAPGLPSLSAAEITLAIDPDSPLPRIGNLPLYGLGDWNGGPIAVHGSTGRVYRLPRDGDWTEADLPDATPPDPDRYGDWTAGEWNVDHDAPHLMAESLDAFVRLVTTWTVLRGHFPMAYTQSELLALRGELEDHLRGVSLHAAYSWWTEGLQEVL